MRKFLTIGHEEARAAMLVTHDALRPLSGYIGSDPHGGPQILNLEYEWNNRFGSKHACAVNSATSGLLAACMAIGVEHGDEVIVSPYTMSATAAAPKLLGASLVWADIEPDTYTIDPVEVANKITRKTKAVIATNLFGHPAHLKELRDICDTQGVYLIEDNAQAIFAKEDGSYTGTIGHIGVFSLNVHKHLQVGEGGVVVTNDAKLDKKIREAMNHGEMRGGIVGLNLRMTEVVAAMAREQLKKADVIMARRIEIGNLLSTHSVAQNLDISIPLTRTQCVHSFYAWAALLHDDPVQPIPKPFRRGYLRPLYELPAFKDGMTHFLPVVESVEKRIVLFEVCAYDPTDVEIIDLIEQLGKSL